MKANRAWPALLAVVGMGCSTVSLHAADWTTTDGKIYHDVQLIHSDPDAVTILYADGGARIPLAELSADLQKRFGYVPALAQAAADARAKAAIENAKALQAEMDQASDQRQAASEPMAADLPTTTTDSPAKKEASPAKPVSSSGTHHFMDEITSSASSLRSDPADTSHHSIDEITQSAPAMRPSLSDPTYHTMAHLVYTVNSQGLGPDRSDPNHHTIGQATGGQ
jgi:hypothetical protein